MAPYFCDVKTSYLNLCNPFVILATRDTQFGQELALVMQTMHAQR